MTPLLVVWAVLRKACFYSLFIRRQTVFTLREVHVLLFDWDSVLVCRDGVGMNRLARGEV